MPIHNHASQKHIAKNMFVHECILIIHWDDYLLFQFCSPVPFHICNFAGSLVFLNCRCNVCFLLKGIFFPTLNSQPLGSASSRQFWQTGPTLWLDPVLGLNLVLLCCLCQETKVGGNKVLWKWRDVGHHTQHEKNGGHFWKMLSYMNFVKRKKQAKKF